MLTRMRPEELKDTKLSTTYRVELNALTPEQFISWLQKKLAAHGILEKVHPPEHVVKAAAREVTRDEAQKQVAEEIMRFAGEDLVNFLESKLCEIDEHSYFDYDGLLDDALAKHPKEGWRDIVEKKAREKAEKHARSPWMSDEIRLCLRERLKEK